MSPAPTDDTPAERNKKPIFDALTPWLDNAGHVLEVGAGDGTHAFHAHKRLPGVVWQTSEAPAHHRRLVAALADARQTQLPPPLVLDVRGNDWPAGPFDAIYGANIAHIMDWDAVKALFAGAGPRLTAAGLLCLYGPFKRPDTELEPSNTRFDRTLRANDAAMGLRDMADLDGLAREQQMSRVANIAMPANNRLLIWRKECV